MSSFTPARATFVALFCSASLHGIYTVLFFIAVYLFCRGKGFPATVFGSLVKVFTVVLYAISTIHLALAVKQNYEAFAVDENADEVFADQAGDIVIAHLAMELVNCIIADMILIWRAWVLWNRDWRIVILPCVLLVGSSVTGVVGIYNQSLFTVGGIVSSDGSWALAFAILTMLTNICATGLLAGRIWYHTRDMKRSQQTTMNGRYLKIMLIIVESGAIYLTTLVIFAILAVTGHSAVIILVDAVAHLTGIVPTMIVVLVALRLDTESQKAREISTLSFSLSQTKTSVIINSDTVLDIGPNASKGSQTFRRNNTDDSGFV